MNLVARRGTAPDERAAELGPVNSPFTEGFQNCARRLDAVLLFRSTGGSGGRDIWVTSRATRSEPWTAPLNLGPAVNGPGNDWCPALSPDALLLIFQSDRPGGFGGDDFWISTRTSTSGPWSAAVHPGPEINTTADEAKPNSRRWANALFASTGRRRGP